MEHISQVVKNLMSYKTNARFFENNNNRNHFIQYFESQRQYDALISAGNFKKMNDIIRKNSNFSFETFKNNFNNK